jgi:hypothetical protein
MVIVIESWGTGNGIAYGAEGFGLALCGERRECKQLDGGRGERVVKVGNDLKDWKWRRKHMRRP